MSPIKYLFTIREDGGLGFIDKKGKLVIPPSFSTDRLTQSYCEGAVDFNDWVPVKTKKNLWGFIDSSGTFQIEPKFALLNRFSEDLAAAADEVVDRSYNVPQGKWGYINRKGDVVISFKYGNAEPFYKGLAIVAKADSRGVLSSYVGGYGLIDQTGKEITDFTYERIFTWGNGRALTWDANRRRGYLDELGQIAIPLEFSGADHFCEGLARVEKDGRRGVIDKNGQVVFWSETAVEKEHLYGVHWPSRVCKMHEGLIMDRRNEKCGFRNAKGDVVIDFAYDDAVEFSEGMASVKIKNKWGYVNANGDLEIPPKFDEPSFFREDRAHAKIKLKVNAKTLTRYGFIDKSGKMVIDPLYSKVDERPVLFEHGLAMVRQKDKGDSYIDISGQTIWRSPTN